MQEVMASMSGNLGKLKDFSTMLTLMTVVLFVYQDTFTEITGIGLLNYIDELFIMILVACAVLKFKENMSQLTVKLIVVMAAFLALGTAYCLLFSNYSISDLVMSAFLSVKFFLIVISISIIRPGGRLVKDVVLSLRIVGAVTAVTGLANFFFPYMWTEMIPVAEYSTRFGLPAVMGLFIHQQQYGWFMLFVAASYYAGYKVGKRRRDLVLFIIYAVMSVLSFRMKVIAGIVAILLADLLFAGRLKVSLKKILPVICVAGLIYLLFGDFLLERAGIFLLGTSENDTARYALLSTSFIIMMEYFPFGVGFGKFASQYARTSYSEYYYKYGLETIKGLTPEDPVFATDTFWPAVIGETGIVGLVLYVYFLWTLIKRQLKYIWDEALSPSARYLACFGFFALVQSLVETMGEQAFNSSPQNIFLGCIVGVSICADSYSRSMPCREVYQ